MNEQDTPADDPNWHVCERCGDRFYAFSDWDFCIPCMETVRYELDDRL